MGFDLIFLNNRPTELPDSLKKLFKENNTKSVPFIILEKQI